MTSEAQEYSFQGRVQPWMMACFGPEISSDRLERGDRLLEEVLELLQSGQYPRDRIASLTNYVFDRPQGEINQEVGGVMVTLAAYCLAHGLDMHAAGETELARIWTKIEKIRAKQAAKPTGSALPIAAHPAVDATAGTMSPASRDVLAERRRQIEEERWTPEHDDGHGGRDLARAGIAYAMSGASAFYSHLSDPPSWWPWDQAFWKPKGRRRDLVRAAALVLAEIERIDRARGED